jgi:hypothetical protein
MLSFVIFKHIVNRESLTTATYVVYKSILFADMKPTLGTSFCYQFYPPFPMLRFNVDLKIVDLKNVAFKTVA